MPGNASPGGWAVVDDAIQAEADAALEFLENLIAARRLSRWPTSPSAGE